MAKTQIVLQPADVARLRRAQIALSDVLGAVTDATTRAASVQPQRRGRKPGRKPGPKPVAKAKPEPVTAAAAS